MNFNAIFLRSFRVLLIPFALLYGLIITIRNWLYDKKILRSSAFNFPIICVGNLSVGGTGKSPMVEYLVELLRGHFKVATLSRGYKRKTKGYVLAKDDTTALDIGDEPMQFHVNFPDITVAVGEERIVAIPQLLHDKPATQVIILDDAFQHREVRPGLNILLTPYDDLYTNDFFLPTGDLRDERASSKRADIIIITKCPDNIDAKKRQEILEEINRLEHQQVFFTAIEYGVPFHISDHSFRKITNEDEVLLVCGIANPKPLKDYLFDVAATYYQIDYNDHHIFTIDDLKEIRKKYAAIHEEQKMIITTEKDAVRLLKFTEELEDMPLYVLPIRHKFLFDGANSFDARVMDFVTNFKPREDIQ